MKREARVLLDAPANSEVWVELTGVNACQRCADGKGCGAGIFNHGSKAVEIRCYSNQPVQANQDVSVEFDDSDSTWLLPVAIAYGLPLLCMLLASLATAWAFSGTGFGLAINTVKVSADVAVAVAAACGLGLGILSARKLLKSVASLVDAGLCMQSARIVVEKSTPVTS